MEKWSFLKAFYYKESLKAVLLFLTKTYFELLESFAWKLLKLAKIFFKFKKVGFSVFSNNKSFSPNTILYLNKISLYSFNLDKSLIAKEPSLKYFLCQSF